ncbi:MAG: PAS domain S-box protein [Vicinamibacterales bacterium]|nr:PAS domain S-box protein [Vicinamibacterales bacterium]
MSLPRELRRRLSLISLLFALLLAAVSAAGAVYYERELAVQRTAALNQLTTVAEFKAVQLAAWHQERFDDAIGIAQDELFVTAARRLLAGTSDTTASGDARLSLSSSLRQGKYSAFVLLRTSGQRLLEMGAPTGLDEVAGDYVAQAAASRQPYFAPLVDATESNALFDIYAPVVGVGAADTVEAVLVMRMDVAPVLVPIVRFWPGREESGETLLVHRSPEEVRFVVAPRRRLPPGGIPVDLPAPAAMAARGVTGVFDGVDVRGLETLATMREVAGTNWAIVAKVDTDEINAPVLARLWLLASTITALIGVAAIAVLLFVSREQGRTYRRLYEESRKRQTLNARFEALSSMANDILMLVSRKGAILDVNDRAVETYGYSREEFRHLTLSDIRPPGGAEELVGRLSAVSHSDGLRFESVHQRRDGTPFPVDVSVRLVDGSGDGVIQAIVRDMTAQQATAQHILRLNSLLAMRSQINQAIARSTDADSLMRQVCRTAVESGQFTFAVYNELRPAEHQLRVRFWSGTPLASTYEGQQFPVNSPYGGPISDAANTGRVGVLNDIALHPQAAHWRAEALDAGIHSLAGVPVRVGGAVVGVLSLCASEPTYFRDAETELARQLSDDLSFAMESLDALERRRQAEARFRTLFDAAPFALWVVDQETGLIRTANPAAVRLLGYSLDELADLPASTIFGAEGLPQAPETAGAAPEATMPLATRYQRKDGAYLNVEVMGRIVEFDGRPAWFVAAADVTERKRLEEQLRDAYRMESVGRLAGGIAHDFNNLLTAITGFATLALDGLTAAEPRHGHIEQICRAADRAASLTRQLLAFSRRQILQPQLVNLNRTIVDMSGMLSRLIGEDVHLELRLDAPVATVEVDPAQIEQVLLNLIVNARDAMPRGGRLTIGTTVVEPALEDGHEEAGGPWVELRVSDTGEGIPPGVQARIFEPFFTTKPKGQGTGLGLAMVHGIVTQSRGLVTVSSTPGVGTTFRIRLPQQTDQPAAASKAVAAAPADGHEHVLLVEDDDGVRELAASVLRSGGYRVVTSPDGLHALERRAGNGPVDLLVTDVVMPGMSGPELASRLTTLQPGLRVLFMSGYPDEALSRHGMDGHAFHFLQKPFTPTALLDRVRRVLDTEA